MKTIMIVGSGFNYVVADIVKACSQEEAFNNNKTIYQNLVDLNNLWGELENILNSANSAFPSKNGEEIMQYYQTVFESPLFKNMLSREYNIEYSEMSHQNLLKDEIRRFGERFTEYENLGGYSDLKRLFPLFGTRFSLLLKRNNIESLSIYTTNYDGVLDTLLTRDGDTPNEKQYLFKDGFYFGNFKECIFERAPYRMAHIHGSYKFYRNQNTTYKLKKGISNEAPVMIYNSPRLKEKHILEDSVLKTYYNKLEVDLQNYNRLIIFGNSFKTEPHLKDLIENHFNRANTELVACSLNPQDVVNELQQHYSKEIFQFTTKDIIVENQLIDLLNQLHSPDMMNSNRCLNRKGLVA